MTDGMKPANRVRVVYDGDSLGARVELVAMDDEGNESVYDIPASSVMYFADAKGSKVIVQCENVFVTAHVEGECDRLQSERMLGLAKTPRGLTRRPTFPNAGSCGTCGVEVSVDERLYGICEACKGPIDGPVLVGRALSDITPEDLAKLKAVLQNADRIQLSEVGPRTLIGHSPSRLIYDDPDVQGAADRARALVDAERVIHGAAPLGTAPLSSETPRTFLDDPVEEVTKVEVPNPRPRKPTPAEVRAKRRAQEKLDD